jgi:hypothetical protein
MKTGLKIYHRLMAKVYFPSSLIVFLNEGKQKNNNLCSLKIIQ